MSSAASRSATVKERMVITGSGTSCPPYGPGAEQRVVVSPLTPIVCHEKPQRSAHGGSTTVGSSALVGRSRCCTDHGRCSARGEGSPPPATVSAEGRQLNGAPSTPAYRPRVPSSSQSRVSCSTRSHVVG